MIPLIDCSPIAEGAFEDVRNEDFIKVAKDIGDAMTEIGMCNLINLGIDKKKVMYTSNQIIERLFTKLYNNV